MERKPADPLEQIETARRKNPAEAGEMETVCYSVWDEKTEERIGRPAVDKKLGYCLLFTSERLASTLSHTLVTNLMKTIVRWEQVVPGNVT